MDWPSWTTFVYVLSLLEAIRYSHCSGVLSVYHGLPIDLSRGTGLVIYSLDFHLYGIIIITIISGIYLAFLSSNEAESIFDVCIFLLLDESSLTASILSISAIVSSPAYLYSKFVAHSDQLAVLCSD